MKINATPEKPAKKPSGFRYRPQHAVIVICQTEAEQRRRYESLQKKGWPLRVVSV